MKAKILTAITPLFAAASIDAATVYVDFGSANTSGTINGNHWNVWNPGNNLDLIDINGTTDTGWNLDSTTAAVTNNGTSPDFVFSYATHGAPIPFNNDNIASDALNLTNTQGIRNVRLTTLDITKTYNFQIYGAREGTSEIRKTNYVVLGATSGSGVLTTTGTDIGTDGADYNNNTILTINGITPNASGEILIQYSVNTGGFGYLNAFTVTEVPEPNSAALVGSLGMISLLRRRRHA